MELQFKRESISCLEMALQDVQNIEQTQELRLSDGMPDIGRILSAWGQLILRGKEWQGDSISISGGMMVWVMYLPEGDNEPKCIDTWIPFQIRWDLPENTQEGDIRIECLTRFVDARSVSARKIMLRCGIAALAEAYAPTTKSVYIPEKMPEDVQLLHRRYPVNLLKEAGEKSFVMEEELSLPVSAPTLGKLIYYRVDPIVTDQRVMADKVVFRGNTRIHLLYCTESGQLHSWDLEQPFSQFAELEQEYSGEAEADVLLGTTSLEMGAEDGKLHLKCGLVGQYVIRDRVLLEMVEDAYSTNRELEINEEDLKLPLLLESRRESVEAQHRFAVDANLAADAQFLPDFPRQRRMEDRVRLEMPGGFQLLYYDMDGALQSANARWETSMEIPSHPDSRIFAIPRGNSGVQIQLGSDSVMLMAEPEMSLTTTSEQGISMVASLELGKEKEPGENRPSLILRRAGDMGLWDMAKISGSTMEAIRKANNMEGDPAPGQMVLIPVS